MAFRLPRLPRGVPLVDGQGRPSQGFQTWWQSVVEAIEAQEAAQDVLIADLGDAIDAITAAQNAADTANAAADAANAAAATAQGAADDITAQANLNNSGVTGCTITATDAGTDATITISAHTRVYGDGSSVAVNGGSVTGLAYSTNYYVYYDQASRLGGAVSYLTTTSEATAAQTGDRHLVGSSATPAALGAAIPGYKVDVAGIGDIRI